jgi:hypothetical protein
MMSKSTLFRVLTGTGLIVLVAGLLLTTAGGRSGAANAKAADPHRSMEKLTAVSLAQARTAQQAAFRILRRAPAARDGVPADVTARYFSAFAQSGVDLSQARGLSTPYGPGWLVAIPQRGQICLLVPDVAPGYGITCQTTQGAADGQLVATFVPATPDSGARSEVVAVVPDGAPDPTVTDQAGVATPMSVTADGIAARAMTAAHTVQTRTPSGAPGARLTVGPEPQGKLTKDCGNGRFIEVKKPTPDACSQ